MKNYTLALVFLKTSLLNALIINDNEYVKIIKLPLKYKSYNYIMKSELNVEDYDNLDLKQVYTVFKSFISSLAKNNLREDLITRENRKIISFILRENLLSKKLESGFRISQIKMKKTLSFAYSLLWNNENYYTLYIVFKKEGNTWKIFNVNLYPILKNAKMEREIELLYYD